MVTPIIIASIGAAVAIILFLSKARFSIPYPKASSMKTSFHGRTLTIDGRSFEHPHAIRDVRVWQDRVFVIYDYTEFASDAPAANMVCVDAAGHQLWVAANPTEENPVDAWLEFLPHEPFGIWNFACFACKFNPDTGSLTEIKFTK